MPVPHNIAAPTRLYVVPMNEQTPITCAWCPKVARGWAVYPRVETHLYPSCGGRFHGMRFRTSTLRPCAACHGTIPETREGRSVYCSPTCKASARWQREKARLHARRALDKSDGQPLGLSA